MSFPMVGNEHMAVVEFAPNQKVVNRKEGKRKDPKLNTLDEDPEFKKFLESLESMGEVNRFLIFIFFRGFLRDCLISDSNWVIFIVDIPKINCSLSSIFIELHINQ